MILYCVEYIVTETLTLKFKIIEASWKRQQMKLNKDDSIKGHRVEKKQIPSELTLRQRIRDFPAKSQENPLEKQIAIFVSVKALP